MESNGGWKRNGMETVPKVPKYFGTTGAGSMIKQRAGSTMETENRYAFTKMETSSKPNPGNRTVNYTLK
tara:strand:- start:443 stop:649 length:207 start_codon:yes stop_codon:yes gene_type:complete